MKYYYNDKLIRTSDHVYTHAVISENGKCVACRNGYANAVKAKNAEKSNAVIKEGTDAINALKAGKTSYIYKVGRVPFKYYFKPDDTIEKYENAIARAEKRNQTVDSWQIVELEAR